MKLASLWFPLVFMCILGLALGLRLYKLGAIPSGLYIDEIAMLVDAKSVSQSGLDMHGRPWYQVIYPSYGDFKLPIYLWLASVSVFVLGVTDFALRLPSVLAGIGTLLVAGLIAREALSVCRQSRLWQLATMLVLAVSPWSLLFSRTGFEGHVGQFLLGVSVWMMFKGRSRRRWLVLAALTGGLATYGYFSVRFVWPVIYLTVISLFIWRWPPGVKNSLRTWVKQILETLVVPGLIFGLILIPMIISPLYEDTNRFRLSTTSVLNTDTTIIQSNVYRELAGNQPLDRLLFHRWWLTGRELAKNYADHLSLNYLFLTGDSNLRHGTGVHGLFVVGALPLFMIGAYKLARYQRRMLGLIIIWWLAAVLPASVPETTPHALRSLNALIPLALVVGNGLAVVIDELITAASQKRIFIGGIGLIILVCYVVSSLSFLGHYFSQYERDSAPAWQSGYQQLVREMYGLKADRPLYILPFEERLYLWMMAYGPYTATDFHSWKSQHYMFKHIPSVTFDVKPTALDLQGAATGVVIAGRMSDVTQLVDELQLTVVSRSDINRMSQTEALSVVLVERP